MIKVKDTKLSADIEDDVTQYVTFWGKLKGDINKQEDLVNLVKKSVNKLGADVKDEFKRISEKVLEIKYDDEDLLNVDEVDANKDKLIFKASNKASGNVQDITLLREEAIEKYMDDKADEIADFVYQYILSKGVVDDEDYHHTDNNYTNSDKAKVDLILPISAGLEQVQSSVEKYRGLFDTFIDEIASLNRELADVNANISLLKDDVAALNERADVVDQEVEAINSSLDHQLHDIEELKVSVKDIYPNFDELDENADYALRLVNDSSEGWCFV